MCFMTMLLSGALTASSINFTLHTNANASLPEFTLTCRTEGGPATYPGWYLGAKFKEYNESQIILDTSYITVYENRLHVTVKGRESGRVQFVVTNNAGSEVHRQIIVEGL